MKIQTLMTALVLAASGAAFAQPAPVIPAVAPVVKNSVATPGLDQRQVNQQKRIEQGVASGQLTPKETARLGKRESKLEADKQTAKADGKVTPQERKQLQREANHDSKAIYQQKHDRQHAAHAK